MNNMNTFEPCNVSNDHMLSYHKPCNVSNEPGSHAGLDRKGQEEHLSKAHLAKCSSEMTGYLKLIE